MDDISFHIHRDDSLNLTKDFSSPQQTSSTYYSYQHIYHPHMTCPNNSFHMYDQLITTYNEQPSVSTSTDLSPSKESMNRNICQPYDGQINWVQPISRRRRQRTVFTQSNIQQLDNVFIYNQYPDIELRETLAAQMGVSESRIQVWFKNRRTRARIAQRQQLKMLES